MIDIKAMTPKKWNPIKQDLEKRLDGEWRYKRILRVDKDRISIEGGSVPILFKIAEGKVFVHNKCSRYSGGYTEIDLLTNVKEILKEWAVDNFMEELTNEKN